MPLSTLAGRLLDSSPVEWPALVDGLSPGDLHAVSGELHGLVVGASRLAAYVDARDLGEGHDAAVDSCNRVVAKVRNALGYTRPDNDIRF